MVTSYQNLERGLGSRRPHPPPRLSPVLDQVLEQRHACLIFTRESEKADDLTMILRSCGYPALVLPGPRPRPHSPPDVPPSRPISGNTGGVRPVWHGPTVSDAAPLSAEGSSLIGGTVSPQDLFFVVSPRREPATGGPRAQCAALRFIT